MNLLSLEPEFIVDMNGGIHNGALIIEGQRIKGIVDTPPPSATRISLKGKMLLPGFVNVHSHALQRALRGRVEVKSAQGQDNFWSWRTLMYRDVENATLDDIEAIASLAYLEMLKAGFVSVGEFHYLHHERGGVRFADQAAVSHRIMKAAERIGIRQTLLTCAYERKNWREGPIEEQKRFTFDTASEFLGFASHVRGNVSSPLLNHGVAIHSTRACSQKWIEEVAYSPLSSDVPLHVHASEQTKEVEESFQEHNRSPIEALEDFGALRANTTLIHATHLSHRDISIISEKKARVGLCPSTERNLGDGLCPVEDLRLVGVELCIGTDEQARIDPVNELRDIEEQERLRLKRRCIVAEPSRSVAQSLIAIGSRNGRRSLGLEDTWISGPADLVAIELPLSYESIGPISALNEHFVAGSHSDVSDVFIAGRQAVKNGQVPGENDIIAAAKPVLKRLNASH